MGVADKFDAQSVELCEPFSWRLTVVTVILS